MPPTPLQTLLEERLQSAKGLGWQTQVFPPCAKGGGERVDNASPGPSAEKSPTPPLGTGVGRTGGREAGKAPAWFRFAYLALRSLGFARG